RLKDVGDALRRVDLFMAPSAFLRDRFVQSGMVPADRVLRWPYGHDHGRFAAAERTPSELLRVGYLGTISSYKGVGVLVDALERLADAPVEGRLHGALEIFPDYTAELRRRIANPRTRLLGRFDNRRVGELLAGIDVLVVPSLWWENAPLTISEAFLAGVPVVASNLGGMAEMVRDGENGFLFPAGDAAALADVLRRLACDRALLAKVRPAPESVRDIREDVASAEAVFFRLLEKKERGR
ncbi:MAG TPA: glycosyltransferase, partial [Planctomycetota bacterium]|nr:glycosyltransferase [Planctomycetota bacterium]